MFKKVLNIPNNLKPLIYMLGVLGFLFSSDPEVSNQTFLFCLKSEIEPFNISRINNELSIDNEQINNFNNIDKPIDKKIISKIIASLLSKFPEANGRDFVLLTFLS